MRKLTMKNKLVIALVTVLSLLTISRIVYVNVSYIKTREQRFNAEDYIEYKGLVFKIQGVERYTYEDYRAKYKMNEGTLSYKGVVWILNLDVSNNTSEEIIADYPGISVSVGAASNGFDLGEAKFINKDFSWKYKPGEEKSVKLPYIINCSYMNKRQYTQMFKDDIQIAVSDYELLRRIIVHAAE